MSQDMFKKVFQPTNSQLPYNDMKVKSLQESLPQPIPAPKLPLEALDSRLQSHQDLKEEKPTVQPAPAQTSSPMFFL